MGAKSEGLSQLAYLWGNDLWPFKGPESGNFAKRMISVDSPNNMYALISNCWNGVLYVDNLLHGFPYIKHTCVEGHKVLLLFLFWSVILRLHFVMPPLNVLSSWHSNGPGELRWYSSLADGRSVFDSNQGQRFFPFFTILWLAPVIIQLPVWGGCIRWPEQKADWVPRLSSYRPCVLRMWPWLVVGTVLLCVHVVALFLWEQNFVQLRFERRAQKYFSQNAVGYLLSGCFVWCPVS